MTRIRTGTFAMIFVGLIGNVQAADVSVKGVHLCCGGCSSGAEKALGKVKSLTKVSCDVNSKVISFTAPDEKTAKSAIKALAEGGFFGKATLGKKKLKFPDAGVKKGAKSDTVTIYGLHLCCDACVSGAQKALEKVDRLSTTEFDRAKGTVKVIGQQVATQKIIDALNKAGFYGTVNKPKKPKPKPKKK